MVPNPTSSALVPVKVDNDNLVEEKIDERILAILGIGDVFDLTYEEYISLLKEKSIEYRMSGADVPTESAELITEEFKRVKRKSGKFKVKSQKINFEKVVNVRTPLPQKAQLDPSKLLPLPKEEEKVEIEKEPSIKDILNFLKGDLLSGLSSILESLTQINQTLKEQNQIDRKSRESKRRTGELEKKSKRESELESKPTKKKEEEEKLKTPVINFFDSIKKFVTNVLLGSVVLGLFKWLKDPKNEKAINSFGQFLTDNAPLILGGLLAIASLPIAATLFKLTTAVIGGIGMLGTALGGLTTLLPAFGLFGAFVGGQMIFKNLQKFAGGEDAPAVESELYKLKKDLVLRKGQAQLMSGKEKEQSLKKIQEDEKKLNRIEQELLPRMTKTQSMKRQLNQTKQKLKKDEEELKKLKGYEGTPFYKAKLKDIEISKKIISENEKNIPISQREQDKLMKDIMGPEGAQGDVIDKIDKFIKDSQKMVENLNTEVQPQNSAVPSSSDYVSPFAGARDRAILNASKITGNAPITIGEKASAYSASRGRAHRGRDIAAPSGTGLTVPSESVITDKGVDGGYGNYVVFKDSNGVEHFYGHMIEQSPLKVGDTVSPGNIIGRVGSTGRSTGPHLHWEVSRVMGEVGRPRANIIDPIEMGFPAQAPFTGKVEAAQIAQKPIATPSIPSPTGRSNITMLPLIAGAGPQQVSSGTSPNQAPVPNFSSEDPNNMTMLTVKAIYNMVG